MIWCMFGHGLQEVQKRHATKEASPRCHGTWAGSICAQWFSFQAPCIRKMAIYVTPKTIFGIVYWSVTPWGCISGSILALCFIYLSNYLFIYSFIYSIIYLFILFIWFFWFLCVDFFKYVLFDFVWIICYIYYIWYYLLSCWILLAKSIQSIHVHFHLNILYSSRSNGFKVFFRELIIWFVWTGPMVIGWHVSRWLSTLHAAIWPRGKSWCWHSHVSKPGSKRTCMTCDGNGQFSIYIYITYIT